MAMGVDAELTRRKRKDVAVVAFDDLALAEEGPRTGPDSRRTGP